ncbi:MAG: hypothetical protein HYW33_00245 [Candidatus Blackburnbacteria bacterium]|nr:hypothetical protein [Candidatus Blackburnbacteria bacterium]
MKERDISFLVGRSNQQLLEICSSQGPTVLPQQLTPDRRYLQALSLLQPGLRLGTARPELKEIKTPDRHSLIAQAVRTASENGGENFAGLTLEEKASFCASLATIMANRSRQEAAARTIRNQGESFFKAIGEKGRTSQAKARMAASGSPTIVYTRPKPTVEPQSDVQPSVKVKRDIKPPKPARGFIGWMTWAKTGIRAALAALTISASAGPVDVFANSHQEADVSATQVPTMTKEDFANWSNQFPQNVRKSLQNMVNEDKTVGFDGRVASEIVFMERRLNLEGLSYSLSPNIVQELYGKYISACESSPGNPWQDIIASAAQGYAGEIKVAIAQFNPQRIGAHTENGTRIQTEKKQETEHGNKKPTPNFSEMAKRSIIIQDIGDFEQALILYGYSPEEIYRIKKIVVLSPQRGPDPKNFSFGAAYDILDLLLEATRRRVALSEAEAMKGLDFVRRNRSLMSSSDAISKYLAQI